MDLPIILLIISLCLIGFTSLLYLFQFVYLFLPLLLGEKKHGPEKMHRYAIMIAARNEEAVIPHLLDSINKQDYPAELLDVYVVADNCTDNTVQISRDHGATVFPRNNKEKIGKGYALDFLLEQIDKNGGLDRYDAFMVFDADNLLKPDYMRNMNRVHSDGYEVFCGYRNTKNFASNWLSSGYALWYIHESTHLNRSRMNLGVGCIVSGTGFGFSRAVLEKAGGWKFFTLTEDLEFSAWCAINGIKIGYCHNAMLFDEQPLKFSQSWRQRTRWAQGGLQLSFRYIGGLMKSLFRGAGWQRHTCMETTALSFWGFALGCLSGLIGTVTIAFFLKLPVFLGILLLSLPVSYLGTMTLGIITLMMEWDNIHATTGEKIKSAFTFPLFMISWFPITLLAPFQKYQWAPIYHTVAVSAETLQTK